MKHLLFQRFACVAIAVLSAGSVQAKTMRDLADLVASPALKISRDSSKVDMRLMSDLIERYEIDLSTRARKVTLHDAIKESLSNNHYQIILVLPSSLIFIKV